MGKIMEFFNIRKDQFEKASRLANKIYENLQLDGISNDAKIIKLALFVDSMKHIGEEIDLETTLKLVGGKIAIQLKKEENKKNIGVEFIPAVPGIAGSSTN